MTHHKKRAMHHWLFPCLAFSLLTGVLTGIVIYLFKICAGWVVKASLALYSFVREHPIWLPCLLLGAALLGLLSAIFLKHNKNSRGGGIPTSVAILRGLIDFHWAKNLFGLFLSSLLTFLGGVPLGTEGPSVQMGTAIGRGAIRLFGKKHTAWDRYIMTGGACGGFAVATGAPLSGILFAFEEAHRRFSPLLFMTVSMTVSAATATTRLLCDWTNVSPYLFDFSLQAVLPLRYLWVAEFVGILCGLIAIIFTRVYGKIGTLVQETLQKIPFTAKIVCTFAIVGLLGFLSADFIGSGHDLIHALTQEHGVWYMLLLCFGVRALLLMFANHAGVSGGIFVPTLAFGALIGALCSQIAVRVGFLPPAYFALPLLIGMAAFLAASSRTPITAIAFALEALGGSTNTLPIAVGVMLAFLIIEISGVPFLQDRVIEQKIRHYNKGKISTVVDTFVTVQPEAFAQGKEVRNILWPPTCTVLSVKKPQSPDATHHIGIIEAGDLLHIHYQTYDPPKTLVNIEAIVGTQASNDKTKTHTVNQHNHIVPEI